MSLFRRLFPTGTAKQSSNWERTLPPVPQVTFDENNRRRRTDIPYLLPRDMQEMERLNYQHYILRSILKGNCFAPVDPLLAKGVNVLDIGCGTGIWGREIADAYTQSVVYGFDIEHIRKSSTLPPQNYHFQKGNLLEGLSFAAQQFHYVHQRLLVLGIPHNRWPDVMADLKRVTYPGGWIELVEAGNTFKHAGPATRQFVEWWNEINATHNITLETMAHIGDLLTACDCSNVRTHTATVPVGSWGDRIGEMISQDVLALWGSLLPQAHALLKVDAETFENLLGQLKQEWNNYHTEYEMYFACGQA